MKTIPLILTLLLSSLSFTQVIKIKVFEFETKATFGKSDFDVVMSDPLETTETEYKNFEYRIDLDNKKSTYYVDNVKQITVNIDSVSNKGNNQIIVYMTEPRSEDMSNPWKTQYVIDTSKDNKVVYYMWYDNVYDYTRVVIPTKYFTY